MKFNVILQSLESSALTEFFKFFTFFGSTSCGFIVIALIYLISSKRNSFITISSILLASLTTFALKMLFKIPRPFVQSTEVKKLVDVSGYSFPSGHSTIVSAYSTSSLKKNYKLWWVWAIFVILTMIVVLSRIYLGVHTIYDCIFGIAIGIFVTLAGYFVLSKVKNFDILCIITSIICFGLSFIYTNSFATYNATAITFLKFCGALSGFYLGYFLERKFVNFNLEEYAKKQRIILQAIGIIIFSTFAVAILLFKSVSILWFFRLFLVAMFLTLGVNFILKLIAKKIGGKIEKAVC